MNFNDLKKELVKNSDFKKLTEELIKIANHIIDEMNEAKEEPKAKNLLKEWKLQKVNDTHWIAVGRIYNDEFERFADGDFIRTSKIKTISFVDGKIVTNNTEYNLE